MNKSIIKIRGEVLKISFLQSGQVLIKLANFMNSKEMNEIDMAVAYFSTSGFECIQEMLQNFLKKGSVGLSGLYITQSKALERLLTLKKKPAFSKLKIKFHNPSVEFHPKFFLAKSDKTLKFAIIGSSNLTGGGQKRNIEANVAIEIEDPKNDCEQNFENDVTGYFDYLWESAKNLTREDIEKYAKGEKAKKKIKKTRVKIPKTTVPSYIYVDGKHTATNSFEVRCTDCKEEYIEFPISSMCCENHGDYPSVDVKALEPEEIKQQGKLIHLKINGKRSSASQVDLSCPDCGNKVGMVDAFAFWVICPNCEKRRIKNNETVCRPFECWKKKDTDSIAYKISKSRLVIVKEEETISTQPVNKHAKSWLTTHPHKQRYDISFKEGELIKKQISRIVKSGKWISRESKSCMQIAELHDCSAWQIRGYKAEVTKSEKNT